VRFNENLLHMALAYGFTPRACWTYDPESKGKVESQVKYVRRGFFYGCEFKNLTDLNCQALDWCNEEANARVHGTTGEIPRERLQAERAHLRPLPASATLPFVLQERRATRTNLISVEGNQYSVPSRWARKVVKFRRYEKPLELLDGREVQARFEAMAPEAAAYLQGLSRSRVGSLRDQMEKIISLNQTYPLSAISQAMQRALDYGAFGYGILKRILERQEAKALPDLPRTETLSTNLDVQVEKRDLTYYQVQEVAQ